MKLIAQIAAYILHPLFVPIYLMLFLMEVEPVMSLYFGGDKKNFFLLILVLNVVIGPIVSMLILKRNGWIDSLTMPTLKGRSVSYLLTAILYIATYFLVLKIGLPIVTKALFIGLIAVLLLLSAISIKFKISAHLAALGGVLGVFVWMVHFYGIWEMSWFFVILLLTGLQASSRLYLQAHSEREVLMGWLIGLASTFGCLWAIIG